MNYVVSLFKENGIEAVNLRTNVNKLRKGFRFLKLVNAMFHRSFSLPLRSCMIKKKLIVGCRCETRKSSSDHDRFNYIVSAVPTQ